MEFITTLIHQIVELFAKLQAGGQEAAELFQAFSEVCRRHSQIP